MQTMTHEHEPEIISPAPQPKSFLAFLAEQEGGSVVQELSKELRELTEAVQDHFDHFRGKVSAKMTLNVSLKLENGAFKVETSYSVSRPKAPPSGTIMWMGHDGNLQTSNPKQMQMQFVQRAS